jgi:hypothetical protein
MLAFHYGRKNKGVTLKVQKLTRFCEARDRCFEGVRKFCINSEALRSNSWVGLPIRKQNVAPIGET